LDHSCTYRSESAMVVYNQYNSMIYLGGRQTICKVSCWNSTMYVKSVYFDLWDVTTKYNVAYTRYLLFKFMVCMKHAYYLVYAFVVHEVTLYTYLFNCVICYCFNQMSANSYFWLINSCIYCMPCQACLWPLCGSCFYMLLNKYYVSEYDI